MLLNVPTAHMTKREAMTCKSVYSEDGRLVMFVCGKGVKDHPCETVGCSNEHKKLCDFPLGGKKTGQTCDKKMCNKHANRFNVDDLPEEIRVRVQKHDTFDLCDAHLRHVTRLLSKK